MKTAFLELQIKYYLCTSNYTKMKADIHPKEYRFVVFKDFSCDHMFLGKSCANTRDTIKWEDGNEYPLVKLEVSNMSHPYYTGKQKLLDTAGRIDKFNKKYAKK
ncbi:MAG: type B 50S ribosomal protein L31 [Chitinophagales bacterium]